MRAAAAAVDRRGAAGANVAVLLLSQQAWGSGAFLRDTCACPRPQEIFFPAYEDQQLLQVGHASPAAPSTAKPSCDATSRPEVYILSCSMPPGTVWCQYKLSLSPIPTRGVWPQWLQNQPRCGWRVLFWCVDG